MVLDTEIVTELVEEIAGRDVVQLVELIKGKVDVSEFKIAEKLNLTVNQVRNMLYRLYSHNLVSFTRKKDKKKGWYIYYWTFDELKAYNLFLRLKKDKLKHLKERLENESEGNYFTCKSEDCGAVRMNFEMAMEHNFKCPDCGKVLEREESSKRINAIEREINEINRRLEIPFVETVKRAPRKTPTRRIRKTSKKTTTAKPKIKTTKKKTAKKKITKKTQKKKTTIKKPTRNRK
ncbi:hypothetical protein J4442_01100 [Candidatus Woesearchaeota archaeon]|nr:hypothetical protein [Candidatus Woesearchaeota archaeon]